LQARKPTLPLIELGNVDVRRDISDVRDVVDAYLALIDSDVRSGTFNLCSGRSVAIREIVNCMRAMSGHDLEVVIDERLVRENETPDVSGSLSRLSGATGFRPRFALEETLRWMYVDESDRGMPA
jgi:GDP-6-deoxy-D-talose 4-dehydrogenase